MKLNIPSKVYFKVSFTKKQSFFWFLWKLIIYESEKMTLYFKFSLHGRNIRPKRPKKQYTHPHRFEKRTRIGCFTAASNITGILAHTDATTILLHRKLLLCCTTNYAAQLCCTTNYAAQLCCTTNYAAQQILFNNITIILFKNIMILSLWTNHIDW
jgi:hypothetical protein